MAGTITASGMLCWHVPAKKKELNMKRLIVSAATGTVILIAACSKNNGTSTPTNPTPTPTDSVTSADLITAHIWKIDTIAFDSNKDGVIDMGVPGGLKPCDMDNTLMFNKDSTGIFDEGALKCVDTVAQSDPFTWYFKNSDSVVNITGSIPGELHGDINVLKLNDSVLLMSKTIPYGSSTVNLIVSLKK